MSRAGSYDPDEPESSSGRSEYLTKKDLRWIVPIVLVLIAISIPVYRYLKAQAEETNCKGNLRSIFLAVESYSEQNDGLMPPAYQDGGQESPVYMEQGKYPATWVSLIQQHLSERYSFTCPASKPETRVMNAGVKSKPVPSSFGMYIGLALQRLSTLRNPGQSILLAETANRGANSTFDPIPLKDKAGNLLPYDGFFVGFDNSNSEFDKQTRYVTRLDYQGTSGGEFHLASEGRHAGGSLYLFADGHVEKLKAPVARVRLLGAAIEPPWQSR